MLPRLSPAGGGPEGPGSPGSLPEPDADPEALRAALREFLRELQEAQRERVRPPVPPPCPLSQKGPSRPFPSPCSRQEELRGQLGSLSRRLAEAEAERDSAGARAQQLQKLLDESEQGDAGLGEFVGFGVVWQLLEPPLRVGAWRETEARGGGWCCPDGISSKTS